MIDMALARYRKQAGLTQIQLAHLAGTDRTHISRIETFSEPLTEPMARRVAKALDVSPTVLRRDHVGEAIKAKLQQVEKASGQVEDGKLGGLVRALKALAVDEDVPVDVRQEAVKAASAVIDHGERAVATKRREDPDPGMTGRDPITGKRRR